MGYKIIIEHERVFDTYLGRKGKDIEVVVDNYDEEIVKDCFTGLTNGTAWKECDDCDFVSIKFLDADGDASKEFRTKSTQYQKHSDDYHKTFQE